MRTLLIDADLRKGVLHRLFSKSREPGLSELILGKAPINNAIQKISIGDDQTLYVLPSGTLPPNPAELIGSDRMRKLLAELRQQYEMIVFDTPPLTMVTDAAILGTLVDATMLVARAGVTDKRALQHAAAQLTHLGVHVSGTIINDFNPAARATNTDTDTCPATPTAKARTRASGAGTEARRADHQKAITASPPAMPATRRTHRGVQDSDRTPS